MFTHVMKVSHIIKKIIGLRATSGILLETTTPIIILKVSALNVRSVVEEDIASHFSVTLQQMFVFPAEKPVFLLYHPYLHMDRLINWILNIG